MRVTLLFALFACPIDTPDPRALPWIGERAFEPGACDWSLPAEIAPGAFLVHEEWFERAFGGPSMGVSAVPAFREGRLNGWKLFHDRRALGALGLQPGDVVRCLNGVSLERDHFPDKLRPLMTATTVVLDVARAGRPMRLLYRRAARCASLAEDVSWVPKNVAHDACGSDARAARYETIRHLREAASLFPVYAYGERVALRLDDVTTDGVFGRLGFRTGDVLWHVDGVDLSHVDSIHGVYDRLARGGVIGFTVVRDGSTLRFRRRFAPVAGWIGVRGARSP